MHEVGEGSTGDPQDVEAIVDTLHRAAEAVGKEVDGVVHMFHQVPSTALFDYLAPGITTLEELRATAAGLIGNATILDFSYPKITVRILSDDTAYSMAYSQLTMAGDGGSTTRTTARVTEVWQKVDGHWKAVHEHSSLPVDVSTGIATMDQPI